MKLSFLKSKIHRVKITQADLNYEGSITIDRALCAKAHFHEFEQVDIYNITNGQRFTTYVLFGSPGEICVNGAAARLVQKDDLIIVAAYLQLEPHEIEKHKVTVVLVDEMNKPKEVLEHGVKAP